MKRRTITNSYWWKEQFYNIRDWFNPRQKWLIKKIPNHFCDKVELIPIILFEILVNFVEDEEGLESIWGERYTGESEDWRLIREPIRKELEEIYDYIKNIRPQLQKELDVSYPKPLDGGNFFDHIDEIDKDGNKVYQMRTCEQIYGKSYKDAYAEVHRLEALIEEKDTWAMMGIVRLRQSLWT
jgi:hypothetical protein